MSRVLEQSEPLSITRSLAAQAHRRHVKEELRQRLSAALQAAKDLPPAECLKEIEIRLLAIQAYCKAIERTFIMVKLTITCDQYGLNGRSSDTATLFRGPNEDASVAICVTAKGSLLHRNGDHWNVYRNVGDVNPIIYFSLAQG